MALELTEKQAITDDVWMPGAYNNWQMGYPMLWKLFNNITKAPSGEYCRYVLEYAKSRGGAFSGATIFQTAKKSFLNAARFPWAYFYENFSYDIEDQVEISGGKSEIDYLMRGLDNMQNSIKDDMDISLWQLFATSQTTWGSDTKPFYGIADLMGQSNTSPAFGRINMADLGTYSREGTDTNIWLAYTNSTSLVMNYSTIQILRRNTMVGGNEGPGGLPDVYMTTPTLWDKLENSIVASQRHYDEEAAKIGFDALEIGIVGSVFWANRCPSGYVAAINMSKFQMKAHEDYYFPKPVWKDPTNQPTHTTQLLFVGSVGTGERRAHGWLTNVS